MLMNYMEVCVDDQLKEILKKQGFRLQCTCDKCIEDIKALTLNNLKPMYVVSDKGIIYSKINELETQFNVDIISELTRAIEIVAQNPKHDLKK